MVGDEAELDVEGDVLGEMAHRVVRLGAEDGTRLVHPLEDAHHHLLVELGRLGEVRRAAEVVDGEDLGAGLGGAGDELRRLDLGEAALVERPPERGETSRGHLPGGPAGRMPPQHGRLVQQHRQARADARAPELHGRRLRGRSERLDLRPGQLVAAGCLVVGDHPAGDPDRRLLRHRGQPLEPLGQHDLRGAAAVPYDQERHRPQPPAPVHPAPDLDVLAGPLGQVSTKDSHGPASPGRLVPGRRGRSGARGATTPSPATGRPQVLR